VPDILPRRRTLLASAATLPLLLAAAGCRSSDVFAGPDPLAGRPRPAPDVVTLAAVIAAEENLIGLYRTALAGDSAATARAHDLLALLAQHEQHLTRLRARLIQPPGTATEVATPRPSATASAAAPARAAERDSAAGLVRRLATAEPALAQLFASIAASDATHVTVLDG
jgi:hypothetical protein